MKKTLILVTLTFCFLLYPITILADGSIPKVTAKIETPARQLPRTGVPIFLALAGLLPLLKKRKKSDMESKLSSPNSVWLNRQLDRI